jgi:glycosyltransferase involved in cell wall biosynthesis
VSPLTGGGNAVFNLLESYRPSWGEVFYTKPIYYRGYDSVPFPELSSRICWFLNTNRPFSPLQPVYIVRGINRLINNKIIRRLNALIPGANDWVQRETAIRDIMECIKSLQIDMLLIALTTMWIDVAVAPELVKRSGLPSVAWFMDDYTELSWTDEYLRSCVRKVWDNARLRFVASEAMQEKFSELYGGDCEVLSNYVSFPERYSEPPSRSDPRLRIVYTGGIHSYYQESMAMVLEELRGLGDQVTLDIYSPDELPPEQPSDAEGVPWRHLPPVTPSEVIELLQEYDVLLLLSSFKPEHRTLAETSQAGKTGDYMAAGRCILAYGPEYSENIRYLQRYGIGEVVTSQAPGSLRASILSLASQPERRRELGERAYYFGREHWDKATNSARLWQALLRALDSPPPPRNRPMEKIQARLRQALLEAFNLLNNISRPFFRRSKTTHSSYAEGVEKPSLRRSSKRR